MKTRISLIAIALLVDAAACAGANKSDCTPNAQQQCKCPDGTQSIQQCQSDGTWGSCECTGQ